MTIAISKDIEFFTLQTVLLFQEPNQTTCTLLFRHFCDHWRAVTICLYSEERILTGFVLKIFYIYSSLIKLDPVILAAFSICFKRPSSVSILHLAYCKK